MSGFLRNAFAFLPLIAALGLTGCSGNQGPISGKVLKGGQPLKVGAQGMVQIHLIDEKGTYVGNVDPDGSFKIAGNDNRGVPGGTYKIAVLAYDPYPTKDLLGGKYDQKKTPISREVKPGQPLEIDLDKL